MFNKLWDDGRVPLEDNLSLREELTKEAVDFHPVDAALGAIIGGSMAAYGASKRHEKMTSGESRFSNKLRHIAAHHQETRESPDKPNWKERMKDKLIAGQLRYARLAQENKNPAIALEAVGGALAGAVGGSAVGSAIRNTKTMNLLSKAGAAKVADVVGLRRSLLVKKAQYQDIPVEAAADQELVALALRKKASLNEEEAAFLDHMQRVQSAVVGAPPEPIKRASMNAAVHQQLRKKASMGELLMRREAQKQQAKDVPESLAETVSDNMEPSDYRTPAREERRHELLGIFGGPGNLSS